ncbi:DUF4870 domain-containing protein [Halodesulfurarchaeum sp.]|uniref:DUF4870 domain-containing protein n=1 Tax=Halodesulfurarchaeum sp. TaxID=1980530 RepID=UPI002FC2C54B
MTLFFADYPRALSRRKMAASTGQPDSAQETAPETQTGLDENIAAALSYVLGFVTGIIFFFIESDNDHIRFHAAQSIVVFGGLFILSIAISFFQLIFAFGDIAGMIFGAIFGLLSFVIWIAALVLWIYLMVRSYQGKDPHVPGAVGLAESIA